jgi:hypothetical protein
MSEPIKPNATQTFYNTTIPSLTDDANIQEALRMYHYGTSDGSIPDDSGNPIQAESIASYLGGLQTQIDGFGIGSEYSSTEPSLTNDDNGYIWVDSNSSALIFDEGIPTIAFYQATEPATGLVAGMLWVDSDDDSVYVYNGTSWDAVASGGSSYTAGSYAELSLTGLGVDVSAASAGQFQFDPGSGLEYFGAAVDVTSGYTKNTVTISVGAAVSASGAGQIILQRVIDSNPLSTTTVAAFTYANGNIQFTYTDTHGQSAGTNVAYIMTNGTTDAVTFNSSNSSALQVSVQEVA